VSRHSHFTDLLQVSLVIRLMESGLSPRKLNSRGRALLHLISEGEFSLVVAAFFRRREKLIAMGHKLGDIKPSLSSADFVALKNNLDERLDQYDVNITALDNDWAACHFAAVYGKFDILESLKSAGAKVHICPI
jgi:ankyrin repeat protein